MKKNERELIRQLVIGSISEEDFLKSFTVNLVENSNYFKQLLESAYDEKDDDAVARLIYIGSVFNLFTEEHVQILCKLMESKWHEQHEDIATIFEFLKSPKSIESLYKAAITEFEYLDYDENYALAVKCIWALGQINTVQSRQKLELLSKSDNEIISKNAIKQLKCKA